MNKTVKNVFMLIGVLVAIFLAWQLIFNDGGILKTAYNGIANGINGQWAKVAGDKAGDLIPAWGSGNADDNGKGFDIDTSKGTTTTGG